jgi:hypothetical protein
VRTASVPDCSWLYWRSQGHWGGSAFLELLTCIPSRELDTSEAVHPHSATQPSANNQPNMATAMAVRERIIINLSAPFELMAQAPRNRPSTFQTFNRPP